MKKQPVPNEAHESFSAWLRSWRYFFWLLGLFLAIAVFYGEENWRGRRAWNAYQQQLKARSESTDASSFVPEIVPVSENFARTPFLAPLFGFFPVRQRPGVSNAFSQLQNFAPRHEAASRAIKPT